MQELHTSVKQSLKRENLAQEYCAWMVISLEKSASFSADYKLLHSEIHITVSGRKSMTPDN